MQSSEQDCGLDWSQSKPTPEEISEMWNKIQFSALEIDQEISGFIQKLSNLYSNGGARLYHLKVTTNPTFDWFGSRNRLEEIQFFENFIRNPQVKEILSELDIKEDFQGDVKYGENIFDFDGKLASLFTFGGAYHDWKKSDVKKIKHECLDFLEKLIEDRYLDFKLMSTYESWAGWFYGIAWDPTYLLYDQLKREVWLLVVTDTD